MNEVDRLKALVRYLLGFANDQGADISYLSEDEEFDAELAREVWSQ